MQGGIACLGVLQFMPAIIHKVKRPTIHNEGAVIEKLTCFTGGTHLILNGLFDDILKQSLIILKKYKKS
jgi:hypothetical protein